MTEQADLHQPISDVQLDQLKIEWVPRDTVRPNKYNPNQMTYHDRQLLKTSLLEDGWTQPIVTLPDRTIVDGEQRWTTAGLEVTPEDIQAMLDKMDEREADGHPQSKSIRNRLEESKRRLQAAIERDEKPTIAAITGGLVPITTLDLGDDAHKMISTIRHNRARGTHQIDAMAGITQDLVNLGLDIGDLEERLGMDDEEVGRFLEAEMREASAILEGDDFSQAWEPAAVADLPEDDPFRQALDASAEAAQEAKEYEQRKAKRNAEIEERYKQRLAEEEAERDEGLTSTEREQIREEIEEEVPEPDKPDPPKLRKLVVFFTPDQYAFVDEVTGDHKADALFEMCVERGRAMGLEPPTGNGSTPESD